MHAIAGAVTKPVQLNRRSECLHCNYAVPETELRVFITEARGYISFNTWHGTFP